MSYLLNFEDDGEDEVPVDNRFLLNDPNDILIDVPTLTVSNFVPAYSPIISDPLADLGSIVELETPAALTIAASTVQSQSGSAPPPKQHVGSEQNYQDKVFFMFEMEKNIVGAINESIKLLNMDPREYHPFYLRIFKYITIGQRQGHIPPGEIAALKIWEKYDKLAVEQWQNYQINPTPFDTEQSPYAVYVLTRKVYINDKLVTQQRDETARVKKFRELERKARKVLKESLDYSTQTCDIKSNLELRLKFFNECLNMTHPADTIRMNRLWANFCCDFNRQPIKLSEALQLNVSSAPAPAAKSPNPEVEENDHLFPLTSASCSQPPAGNEAPIKTIITLKVKVGSPEPSDEDHNPSSPLPSYSPPPSPHADDQQEIEQKYQVSVEHDATENASNQNIECKTKITKRNANVIDENDAVPNKKEKQPVTSFPKKLKLKTGDKGPRKITSSGNTHLKKSKLIQSRIALARKKLKVRVKQVTASTSSQDKVLSVLEKKISSITLKLKKSKPRTGMKPNQSLKSSDEEQLRIKVDPVIPVPSSATAAKPEFTMCEECGQTYRTYYLQIHKEAVHNPNNKGIRCPLCPQHFKRGTYLWAHVLGTHMPSHLDPGRIAMEVEPLVEKARSMPYLPLATPPPHRDSADMKFTTEVKKTGSTWNCPHCNDKPFSTKATLQRHLHLIHGEGNLPENKLVCPQCPKSFKEKATLDQHIRREHEGIENRCDICSKRFQTAGKLWKHKVDSHNIVTEPPIRKDTVQCEHCGENCLYGKQFVNHVKNHHPDMLEETLRQLKLRRNEKKREAKRKRKIRNKLIGKKESGVDYRSGGPKECPECGKILQGNLPRHLAQFHGIGDGVIKTFVCPIPECGKKYKSRVSLRVHISENHDPVSEKIATKKLIKVMGVQPSRTFECTLCGWKVADKHECMVHLVVGHPHCLEDENDTSGYSAVKCPHCEQEARTQDQIRNHVELFHADQVWRCPHPECGKVILGPVDLQEHFYKDHGEGNKEEGAYLVPGGRAISNRRTFNDRRRRRGGKGNKQTYKRTPGKYPCYRCIQSWSSEKDLDLHVKKTHPEAYWPCKECCLMCFTERSNLFHRSTLCKVKREVADTGKVVGFDQITMECQICDSKIKCAGFSRHLKTVHGVVEDGDLWKCEYCQKGLQKFRSREYWLAHMDDRHGGDIDIEEIIEVARQINTLEEVDLEKVKTLKKRGTRGPARSWRMTAGVKKVIDKLKKREKAKRGRPPTKKKLDSSDSEADEEELHLDDNEDADTEFKPESQRRVSKRNVVPRKGRRLKRHRGASPVKEIDVEELMSNVPLKIRKMFRKQCSVRVERLSAEQIEMYKRS